MPHRDAGADVRARPAEGAGPPTGAASREANPAIRASTALMRTRAASQRDAAARVRDLEAAARDQARIASDRAGRRGAQTERGGPDTTITDVTVLEGSLGTLRSRAATDREHAAADRAHAAADRAHAADDRRQARIALRDAHLDELTGAYTRGPGLLALQHEIARAHRSSRPFVLALVDIDGLRRINAHDGQDAGDAILRAVATALRARLRSYDPIVRVGGDGFLCALSDTRLPVATRRIREVQAALPDGATISCGLAQLVPGELLDALTARADAELDRAKRGG
jgi:diguanylate cyclase (GGDEF)-like protein